MKQTGTFLRTNAWRYALTGALFGLVFPVLATLIRVLQSGLPLAFGSILAVQLTDPLLWIIDTAPLFLGFFAWIAGRRQDMLEKTNQALLSREQELQTAQAVMEQRVSERTQELTAQNLAIAERAEHLTSVVDSSRTLLSSQGLDRLLPLAAQVISRQFKYYHVGIYLLDEQQQHALLVASSDSMPQGGQYLRMGEQSHVEFTIRSGQASIVNDTSTDPMFKPDPELPSTRSQLVLPLKSVQNVIGALDMQSETPGIFTEEYVSILSILADLVTIAIQNSILNERTQRAMREVEVSSQQVSARVWEGWLESIGAKGYRYDGIRAEPLKAADPSLSNAKKVQSIPVRLRGRTIGNLKIKLSDSSQTLSEDDHAIAEATAERAALALEGARLLDEAKRRAAREAFLSEMATKLSTSFRLDSILRDTVEELGHSLAGSTVTFQLIDPTNPPPGTSKDSEEGS